MKRIFGLLLVIAVVIGIVPYAGSVGAPPLPPGLSADDWIPIGDTAGFVVTQGDSQMGSARSMGVVKGYFVIRRGNYWFRIDSAPDLGMHPATLK
jgi:hypothetical protein